MKKLLQLERLLKETGTKQDFNIVEDLKGLELSFGLIKPKEFRKKLNALILKYEKNELTEVRESLLKECRKGNVYAIRLYTDYFKPQTADSTDDGLLEAIAAAGKEAFADEI